MSDVAPIRVDVEPSSSDRATIRATVKFASDIMVVPTPLPTLSADQREAAFIRLLAEAIASDIRRGGTLADEPLDELDEESATVSSEVRKVEEADGEQ